jgi:predicted phage terminase large subunit-like protein
MSFRTKSKQIIERQTLELWLPTIESDLEAVKRSPPVDNTERLKYQNSLWEFFNKAWEELEPATPMAVNWHLELIVEHLELVDAGVTKKLLINIAPRHLKSILCSVIFPCWQWLRRPALRGIYLSYASSLANDLSDKRRSLIQSKWYQSIAPELKLSNTKNRISEFENNFTGAQISRGLEGAVTGSGGTVQIWDDANNPEKVESDAVRDRTLKNYKDFSVTRRNDPKNTVIVIIQQRTHESDVSGYVLAEDADNFTTVILPTVAEKDETIVFPKSGKIVERSRGDLLHPERFGHEEVAEAKKTLGSYMFAGRHQQRPIPREGGILKEQYWQYYLAPPPCRFKVVAWDTAQEAKNHNDYSAGVLMGSWNNNYYVLDVFQGRLEFPELKRRIRALYERDRPNAVIIEKKSSGHSLLQELRRDTTLPLIAQEVDRDKIARVEAISPTVEAGRVFLPHNAPFLADFIAETAGFPNAAYDDQVDAFVFALNYLIKGSGSFAAATTGKKRSSSGLKY